MTTGRINQVTIFEQGPRSREVLGGPSPLARVGVSRLGGVTEHPVGRPPPEPNRRGVPHQPSICRDWIPQGEVRRRARTNRIAGPNFRMPTSSGGYPTAVTSSQRRIPAFKRAPECVEISMANGQQPTDLLRRETTAIGRIGFGRPLHRRRRVGRTNSQRRPIGRTLVKCVPRRDSAMAVSVGGGPRIDGANTGR